MTFWRGKGVRGDLEYSAVIYFDDEEEKKI